MRTACLTLACLLLGCTIKYVPAPEVVVDTLVVVDTVWSQPDEVEEYMRWLTQHFPSHTYFGYCRVDSQAVDITYGVINLEGHWEYHTVRKHYNPTWHTWELIEEEK